MSDIKIKTIYESNVQQGANADEQALGRLAQSVDDLKATLGEVQSAQNETANAMQSMADAVNKSNVSKLSKDMDNAKKSTRSFSDVLKAAKSSVGSLDYPFKNLISSLTRIAKLRVLRGIIRSITGAFKEGLQNIYQYSAALNNADASHMKSSLDNVASSFLYMKNAVASAVAPLIAQLIPTLVQVTEWFVNAASAIAQFFAVLGGQTMYTRAKKTDKAFADIGSSVGGATKAIKEYQNTILGFDELNPLNDVNDNSGGGGGGGASAPNYADMFEEVPIEKNWMTDLAKFLKENWDDILDIVLTIGAALATWKIASGVIDFFTGMGWLKGAKVAKIAAGLLIAVEGVTLAYKGGYDIGYEGATLMNIVKTAIGGALAAIGGFIAFGPAGAVISFGVALVGSIIGFQLGEREKHLDETYHLTEGYQEYLATMEALDEVLSHTNTVVEEAQKAWKDYSSTIADLKLAEVLVAQIEELDGKTNKTALDNKKLKTYVKQLNDLGLEGITAEYDELTGTVKIDTRAVRNNIKQMKEAAKAKAYVAILEAAWKDEAQATIDAQIATDAKKEADENLAKAQQDLLDYETKYAGTLEYSKDKYDELQQAVWDWQDAQNKAYEAEGKAKERLKQVQTEVGKAEKAYGNLETSVTNTSTALDGVYDSAKKAVDGFKLVNGVQIKDKDWSKVAQGFKETDDKARVLAGNIKLIFDRLMKLKDLKVKPQIQATISTTQLGQTVTQGVIRDYKKDGGYVPTFAQGGIHTADLFLANENNVPELVGRIGNRTAVANQGQMVAALADGVAEGFMAVQGGEEQVEFNVYMDSTRLAHSVQKGQRNINRRYKVAVN